MSEKMSAILIDDELSCTESLSIELSLYCPQIDVIGCFQSPSEGRNAILKNQPDIVFLDIEMPGMNGFELLESLPDIQFKLVFVTAYDEYALKAFRFSAVDYILKPIQKKELERVYQKLIKNKPTGITSAQLNTLIYNIQHASDAFENLAIPTMEGIEFIPVNEIIYCKADNNYTHLVCENKLHYLLSKSIKTVEHMLADHRFMRIHQSYLINLDHLKKYIKGQGGEVILSNGDNLPVSRSRKEPLLKKVKGTN